MLGQLLQWFLQLGPGLQVVLVVSFITVVCFTAIWLTFFVKCPRCRKVVMPKISRVHYTQLFWENVKHCPYCGEEL